MDLPECENSERSVWLVRSPVPDAHAPEIIPENTENAGLSKSIFISHYGGDVVVHKVTMQAVSIH